MAKIRAIRGTIITNPFVSSVDFVRASFP